jgi:hypothetical protein
MNFLNEFRSRDIALLEAESVIAQLIAMAVEAGNELDADSGDDPERTAELEQDGWLALKALHSLGGNKLVAHAQAALESSMYGRKYKSGEDSLTKTDTIKPLKNVIKDRLNIK